MRGRWKAKTCACYTYTYIEEMYVIPTCIAKFNGVVLIGQTRDRAVARQISPSYL